MLDAYANESDAHDGNVSGNGVSSGAVIGVGIGHGDGNGNDIGMGNKNCTANGIGIGIVSNGSGIGSIGSVLLAVVMIMANAVCCNKVHSP